MPEGGVRLESQKREPSGEDRKAIIFERIEKKIREKGGDAVFDDVGRVFEHSTEDGILLADRLHMTPGQIREAIFHPGYRLKHREIIAALLEEEENARGDTPEERDFLAAVRVADKDYFEAWELAERTSSSVVATMLRQEALKKSKDPLEKSIDALYADVARSRSPAEVRGGKERPSGHGMTRGEYMAAAYLGQWSELLEGPRYYTGPIKERFNGLERVPALQNPSITEDEFRQFLEKFNVAGGRSADEIITQFKGARVVRYKQIDAAEKRVALAQLKKEATEALPDGWEIVLDRKEDAYKIEKKGGEKDGEKEEGADKEREKYLEAIERKALDAVERALEEDESKGSSFAKYLAGLDSPRAWEIRRKMIAKFGDRILGDTAEGLAGLDSEAAWEMREKAIKLKGNDISVTLGLAGLDSERAWQMRRMLLDRGVDEEFVFRSLVGVDSERAWQMREGALQKYKLSDVAQSLAGLDSERAWEARGRILKETRRVDEWTKLQVAKSLAGLDSERAWEMREELFREFAVASDFLDFARSLAGLDSERAWEMRKTFLAQGLRSPVAQSLAGLDSPKAWEMRARLRKAGVASSDIVAGIAGFYATFTWRFSPERKGEKTQTKVREIQDRDREKKERFAAIEEKALDELERAVEQGEDSNLILRGLVGIDSPRAWKIRKKFLKKGDDRFFLRAVESVQGLDSPEAWKLREDYLSRGGDDGPVLRSLAGLDSPRAWEMRKRLRERAGEMNAFLFGLVGLDSPRAWEVREEFFEENMMLDSVAHSLAGLDSPRAWQMREELMKKKKPSYNNAVADSLMGLDSPRAWQMRTKLRFEEGTSFRSVALSLAGLDSEEAWDMRDELLADGTDPDSMASSLSGVDSPKAWEWRKMLKKRGAASMSTVLSVAGSPITFAWRFSPEWRTEGEGGEAELAEAEELVEAMNLVRHPEAEGIRKFLEPFGETEAEKKKREREELELNPLIARILTDPSRMDREAVLDYLKTNPAVEDRAPELLAKELFERMVPYRRAERTTSLWQGFVERFTGKGKGGREAIGSPETACLDRPETELVGGGSEMLSDTRNVVESREPMEALLTTGIYGRYSKEGKRWEKVYFPVHRELLPPTKETTLTVPSVQPGSRILFPMPPDARFIPERVRGITKEGEEIPITASVNSLGEAVADVPKGVEKVLYSIERELAFQPMEDVSGKDYETFKRRFEKEHGGDMSEPLARLPQDIRAELRSEGFRKLGPKMKVRRIEELVRAIGYYDVNNEEVRGQKAGRTMEEQILIAERRCADLRGKSKNPKTLEGKRFAGVCADYAQIVCAALREAGVPSGIMQGISLNGKEGQMRNSHATAFVPWPTEEGGIRIVPVDGTPSAGAEMVAATLGLRRPTIGEAESHGEKTVAEELEMSREVVQQLLDDLQAGDAEAVRKLSNGALERALNLTLSHEVKYSNVRAITRMLESYWYGGLGRMEGALRDMEIRKALEGEILRERAETPNEDALTHAGTELMKTVREYITRFSRAHKNEGTKGALDLLDRITELAKKELTPEEHRAMVAVVGYLRAKKMR